MSTGRNVNLGLVAVKGHTAAKDLDVAARVARVHDPRVRAVVLRDHPHPIRRRWLARRPSLFLGPRPFRQFVPLRGRVFSGVGLTKHEECRRLESAGFRIPRTALLTEHERPDLSEFGPYVVVKPDVAAKGALVKIVRNSRVRWKAPVYESDVYEGSQRLLVQEFIYTGPWPVSHRVQTLFGEALVCIRMEAHHDRTPLSDRYAFKQEGGGRTIVATSKGCSIGLCDDDEMIDVAERVHALFPECAQLGVDLIREVPSGDVYVLEVNCRGGGWLLSSASLNETCGADLREQCDGLARAGRALADAAGRLGERRSQLKLCRERERTRGDPPGSRRTRRLRGRGPSSASRPPRSMRRPGPPSGRPLHGG